MRVAIVEDDPGVRAGLETLFGSTDGYELAGSFASAEDLLGTFDGAADVVLMDINLPGLSGIEAVARLRSHHPELPIVMLTVYDDAERIFEALKAGATGYLLKRTPANELLEAVADVCRGGAPMSGAIARKVVQSFHLDRGSVTADLSPREREVLDLLAKGYRYREIGEALFISVETVRSHLRSIYDKLHVRSGTEAVVKYLGR